LVKREKAEKVIDTTLGGEKAKKAITRSNFPKMITALIRDGYLYQIEVSPLESDFWNKIYQIVTSSFRFTDTEEKKEENKTPSSQENTSLEDSGEEFDLGEEIIE